MNIAISNFPNWKSITFLSKNPSKTEFLVIGLPRQLSLSKLNSTIHLANSVSLSPVDCAWNLGVILVKNMSFAQPISSDSKSCSLNIPDLRLNRNTNDRTIAILLSFTPKLTILQLSPLQSFCYSNQSVLFVWAFENKFSSPFITFINTQNQLHFILFHHALHLIPFESVFQCFVSFVFHFEQTI